MAIPNVPKIEAFAWLWRFCIMALLFAVLIEVREANSSASSAVFLGTQTERAAKEAGKDAKIAADAAEQCAWWVRHPK